MCIFHLLWNFLYLKPFIFSLLNNDKNLNVVFYDLFVYNFKNAINNFFLLYQNTTFPELDGTFSYKWSELSLLTNLTNLKLKSDRTFGYKWSELSLLTNLTNLKLKSDWTLSYK